MTAFIAANDLTFADLHVRKRHESVEDGFLRSIIEIRKDGVSLPPARRPRCAITG